LLATAASLTFCVAPTASAAGPARGEAIDDSYIVVYERSAGPVSTETAGRERRLGFKSRHRFQRTLEGFSATLSPRQVERLRGDPEVDFVAENRRVRAAGSVPLVGADAAPTGVRRILAGSATTARQASGVKVAVIDTGIKLSHPDLNTAGGTNCISPGSSADDDNGHGTHVAGTIAAENDGSGVVGVAPGTKTYAVKVLDANGDGSTASVVCGIEWVTANHAGLNIDVANMSLGGTGPPVSSCASTTDPQHLAICNSTAAGVNYVVAAGNSGWDFDYPPIPDVPAAYPQVLTVSALTDSDGAAGGLGAGPSCDSSETDDTPASFSNYALTAAGEAHTIAAPGVCIRSTWSNGGYATISGTSMASPHMAGVLARCLDEGSVSGPCSTKTPAEVITYLRDQAQSYNGADPGYGFVGDPNSPGAAYYGFLTGPFSEADAPPHTSISSGPSGTTSVGSAGFEFTSNAPGSTFECKLDQGAWQPCTSPKSFTGLSAGGHTFSVRATDPEGDTDPTPATRVWTVASAAAAPTGGGSTPTDASAIAPTAPARANLAGARRTIRVRRGRFSYVFRAGAGLTGSASFRSIARVRVSASARRRVMLARKSFTVPSSRRVTLKIKLSRKSLRILRRNRRITLRVTVKLRNAAGLSSTATRRLTLKI
jgi:subtilisin family serine protease